MAQTETNQRTPYGRYAITLIAFAACVWYLIQLGRGDVLSDEALIGFRSLGYLDFLFSEYQTTPLEWFAAVPPWWTKLWFHDHPPLVFLFQHFSFLLFGPTAFALRFPSALAAAVSVFLIGAIAQRQWGTRAGIMAALGLAVLTGHVSMARQGLQEALLAALLLASFYCALRAREGGLVKWWYAAMVVWGLAFLTKLTAVGFAPALIYLIWRGRKHIARRHRWGLVVVTFCFVAPLMIYNTLLFRATGHFDFQFSYLLGQEVQEWQARPGREYFPDITARVQAFIPNITTHASIPMNVLAFLGVAALIVRLVRKRSDETDRALGIILTAFCALFLVTGPLPWFTYLLWPWLVLMIARMVTTIVLRRIVYSLIGLILVLELAVAWNTVYATNPRGREGVTYLSLWRAHAQWGYQAMEQTLAARLQGLYPGGTFPVRYQFLEEKRQQYIRAAKAGGQKPATLLMVYDTTMHQNALLWTFFRRSTYEGWPVLDVDTYRQMREEQGEDVFWRQGFEGIVFVRVDPESDILTRTDESRTDGGQFLEDELEKSGLYPSRSIISPKTGKDAFRVYELESSKAGG